MTALFKLDFCKTSVSISLCYYKKELTYAKPDNKRNLILLLHFHHPQKATGVYTKSVSISPGLLQICYINHTPLSYLAILSPQDALRKKQWGPLKSRLTVVVLVLVLVPELADKAGCRQNTSYLSRRAVGQPCYRNQ